MDTFPWWTEQHRKLADDVAAFAREIAPEAERVWWKREFPRGILKAAADRGYFGAAIPVEYGGLGLGATGLCIVCEAMGGVAGSGQATFESSMFSGTHQLLHFGTEDQRRRFLPRIAHGEIGSIAITEPFAGTDAGSIETRAVRDGDRYLISGKKRFITSAGAAQRYMLYARTSDGPQDAGRNRHLTAFIVEKGMPGFTVEKINELLGWDNVPNGSLDLDSVPVPVANRVGAEGDGWNVLVTGLNLERTIASSSIVGMLGQLPKAALWYGERRVQFGRATASMPVNQFKIADIMARLRLARLAAYYAAYLLDSGETAAMESCVAKLYAADMALQSAIDAMQVVGADATTRFYPLERAMRAAKMYQMAGGTDEALKLNIFRIGARELGSKPGVAARSMDSQLGIPVPLASAPPKLGNCTEELLLRVLAEDYRVNPGLYMTRSDLAQRFDIGDEILDRLLAGLEKTGLVRTFRKEGRIEMARASYEGLRRAGPMDGDGRFPVWVKPEDIF